MDDEVIVKFINTFINNRKDLTRWSTAERAAFRSRVSTSSVYVYRYF